MQKLHAHLSARTDELWQNFIKALKDKNLTIPEDSPRAAPLKAAMPFSRYVSQAAVTRTGIVFDLIESGDFITEYGEHDPDRRFENFLLRSQGETQPSALSKLWTTLARSQFEKQLRLFRHRELVRIAVRDLAGAADLETTLKDLTALADLCIQKALDFLFRRQCMEWGTPVDTTGKQQHLVVLGMGKLGAHELNFSSDVDLIFTYPEEGRTENGAKSTSNEDFFVRLGRNLIQTLGARTAEGFVFRVDMRLRPFGESGPLAVSFGRMESYYETQGREWERYALIKARVVAGDDDAGRQLLGTLRPFVFRRYLDYNAFDSLRDMKQRIAAEVKSKGLQDNIKLGPGGIREVEFFGQMFQLLRGGVNAELQERGILTVLQRLVENGSIPADTGRDLKSAYEFLRRTENHIQEFDDRQTHLLPDSQEDRLLLALSMDFDNWPDFIQVLDQHRRIVQHHFNALLESGGSQDDKPAAGGSNPTAELAAIWQGLTDDSRGPDVLIAAGYTDPDKAMQLISDLQDDHALRSVNPLGKKRLDRIIPAFVLEAGRTTRPQLVLQRLFALIKSICRRTAYLSLLVEYPAAITHLVRLSDASPWIADLLSRHPALLDELLDPRTLYSPPKREDLVSELHYRLDSISDDDFEHQLETMRIFKQTNILRVAASDITDVLPLMKVSDHLSDIAEVVLGEVVDLSWRHLVSKHGKPTCRLEDRQCGSGFAVIAYGKLGGLELGYRSDLDLVFVHAAAAGETREGSRPIDNAMFFARLGQRVLHILSAHTTAGVLYETDMRLRPSGDSGMLVSHIDGFRDYQLNDAWTWEHQALLRARALTGDEAIQQQFEQIRREILTQPREERKLREEVSAMRRKLHRAQPPEEDNAFDIKQDPGGIIDIEFLVQYLILLHAHKHPEITRWTDNVRQLQELSHHNILDQQTAFGLRRAYLILRAMGHRLNLKGLPAHVDGQRFKGLRDHVQRSWDRHLG